MLTIIILLILAGISINMIAGQDGILNKALQSKEATIKAQGEEKINLMMAEYQLNGNNNDINLKDYVTENLPSASITEDEDSKCLQVWYNNEKYIISPDGNINKIERTKNLVRNGFLEYKDSRNFWSLVYNQDGFLSVTSTFHYVTANDYIEISHDKKYYQSITIRTNDPNAIYLIGLEESDIDKNRIDAHYVCYVENTLTELSQDINDGDTVIYLNDISGFKKSGGESLKGLIVWNYRDSTGYQYPELTYSRNIYTNIFEFANIDKENNCITLNKPWDKGSIAKGTKLSQGDATSTFNYGLVSKNISSEWTTYTNIITGYDKNKEVNVNNFRAGTKYVRPLFLLNYNSNEQEATTDIKDIIFQEIE